MFVIKVTNPRSRFVKHSTVVDKHQQPLQFSTREQAEAEADVMRARAEHGGSGLAYAVISA